MSLDAVDSLSGLSGWSPFSRLRKAKLLRYVIHIDLQLRIDTVITTEENTITYLMTKNTFNLDVKAPRQSTASCAVTGFHLFPST